MLNTRVLKEPLGFIRILELPLTILAFAATAGYSAETVIYYQCDPTKPDEKTSIRWGYPFSLSSVMVPTNFCNPSGGSRNIFTAGAVSQSQFFVFTGVICFLYLLIILAIYLMAWPAYEGDKRVAMGDLLMTAILAFFWFVGSCAWASGLSTVKSETDEGEILDTLREQNAGGWYPCNNYTTQDQMRIKCGIAAGSRWNYASLNVAAVTGFACFALWAANLWFIYKETAWYKARAPTTTVGPAAGGTTTPGGRGYEGGI